MKKVSISGETRGLIITEMHSGMTAVKQHSRIAMGVECLLVSMLEGGQVLQVKGGK
ncbi:hypothetical protein GCM10007160_02960 [Litchfieldella qijiaojingensis]|uniref:Uncharacterized protein n=1 Tax=Litchfieldella qijiaojingensis TaxID=980347 RepID=A0ABQ2YCJ0_9GAMM|nr:hypothetical protein GCM10007160_02960 [Halomonas qijiaojingensis]